MPTLTATAHATMQQVRDEERSDKRSLSSMRQSLRQDGKLSRNRCRTQAPTTKAAVGQGLTTALHENDFMAMAVSQADAFVGYVQICRTGAFDA